MMGYDPKSCLRVKELFIKGLTNLVANSPQTILARVNDQLDVEVDSTQSGYKVGIRCGQKLVASGLYTRGDLVQVGDLLEKNLGILCAVHQAEIEKWCPNSVAGIEATKEDGEIHLKVKFKNGHWIGVTERDAQKSAEFKAHCLMVYDLPPL